MKTVVMRAADGTETNTTLPKDYISNQAPASDSPTSRVVVANPHATAPLTNGRARAVYCTVAGDLVCSFDGGKTTITIPMDAKTWHPVSPTHIRATSTATVLLAY